MQTLTYANEGAAGPRLAGPYCLAFLLTGHSGLSADVTLEALDLQDGAEPFFSTWMAGWSRRLVMAKALAAIRPELAASAHRTARSAKGTALPSPNWALDQHTTKVQLERALLAIDVFPRCVLLLSVFEGVSLDDAAILLDSDRNLVRKAQRIGLRELTRNLARIQGAKMQGCTSGDIRSNVVTSEMQHA